MKSTIAFAVFALTGAEAYKNVGDRRYSNSSSLASFNGKSLYAQVDSQAGYYTKLAQLAKEDEDKKKKEVGSEKDEEEDEDEDDMKKCLA
mmetsp:Transcript_18846/g.23431  ORF Transcript_18846/g.23431 Transcript_18846/m.23431 type:complete len:90 (+) Transcript_18846:85-354(+)